MSLSRNISGLKFGGTHRVMPGGQVVLTELGLRMKGKNRNKLYRLKDDTLGKYKHFGICSDLEIKKLITRWQRKFFKGQLRQWKRKRQALVEASKKPTNIVDAGGDILNEKIQ